ncbi:MULTISPECIES: sulfotransferase family protein [unclassified Coleofasciculus]|uniref:sulfotransferase family protein n=1 Tax=unclassified Coleofasciculus TaxID=2692782 RepID=UPI001882DEA7|nr:MULTISPECIES: sulfotransferase [unclassified Coleofasciculus]MBE9129475.1 sulfotransferase [Coleofasciculus sp. LEGE 07081]MBE9152071.1 sulfotransferase [Coleofasciculus sp. LEGE 07092]
MKLPNFIIIGVQKAGTTSVYNYLNQHPQIYMSPVKETNFLEKDWEELPNSSKSKIDTLEKYCQLFEGAQDEIAIGEASPNYLFHYESSSRRIQRYVPNAKLIAILRNPAERAYSDYLMHIRDAIGNGKQTSLAEQIKFKAHKSFLIRKGFYYTPLKHYFEAFGKDQINVYLYDDLCKDSGEFMREMYRFLGVDDTFTADVSKKAQVAQVPKSNWLNTLLRKQNPLRAAVASGLRYILPLETRQNIRSNLIQINSQDKKTAPLSAEERQQLVELYREDILSLQDLLQRDLSSWLTI